MKKALAIITYSREQYLALVGIRDTLNAKPTRPLPEATLDRLRKSIKVEGDGPS